MVWAPGSISTGAGRPRARTVRWYPVVARVLRGQLRLGHHRWPDDEHRTPDRPLLAAQPAAPKADRRHHAHRRYRQPQPQPVVEIVNGATALMRHPGHLDRWPARPRRQNEWQRIAPLPARSQQTVYLRRQQAAASQLPISVDQFSPRCTARITFAWPSSCYRYRESTIHLCCRGSTSNLSIRCLAPVSPTISPVD